jgi:hypothetical protein
LLRKRFVGARGSILVLVAVAMFPFAGMLAFVLDVSHWFDYSRNLQNRADAAALAAGAAYGDICFRSSYGDQWSGAQSVIGKWAQFYSGPASSPAVVPFDEGTNSAANDPYSDASVFATTGAGPYKNLPNLTKGPLSNYWVRLNANNYYDKGGTNFQMGDFCTGDPSTDQTDPNPPASTHEGIVDVKVTQYQLGNFIPIFGAIGPNIEAHARVEIQQIQTAKGVRPIAVNDASDAPCITANFLDKDGSLLQSEKLQQSSGSPGLWTSNVTIGGVNQAKQVTMPASGHPVTVQLALNDCATSNPVTIPYDYYDASGGDHQFGLAYINNFGSPPANPTTPVIDTGGVRLTGSLGTACDPYFQSNQTCTGIGADAFVKFPTANPGTDYVRAVDCGTSTNGCSINGTHIDLGNVSGNEWNGSGLTINPDTGPHYIDIAWAQLGGKIGNTTCKPTVDSQGNPNDPWASSNGCNGDLGPQQRSLSGIDGTNFCSGKNYDTGGFRWVTVGSTDGGGISSGANTYGTGGTAPHLYVTLKLAGLADSGDTDPPVCLRVNEQQSHQTGMINCGQGNGGSFDQTAIETGCPQPLQIDTRVGANGALTCTPQNTPWDCVGNDPGNSPPVLKGFDNLIGNPAPGNCETNFWPYNPATGGSTKDPNHDFTLADKRAVIMVITTPVETYGTHGTSQIPIVNFAVFYVTGWANNQGGVKGCANNDPAPPGAGNGEIWGHWTSIAVPPGLGSGNGQKCNFTLFGNCVAVLTR